MLQTKLLSIPSRSRILIKSPTTIGLFITRSYSATILGIYERKVRKDKNNSEGWENKNARKGHAKMESKKEKARGGRGEARKLGGEEENVVQPYKKPNPQPIRIFKYVKDENRSPKGTALPFTIETRVILPENMKLKSLPMPSNSDTRLSLEEEEDEPTSEFSKNSKKLKNSNDLKDSNGLNAKNLKMSSRKGKISEEEEGNQEVDMNLDEGDKKKVNPRRIKLRANYKKFWEENIRKPNFDMLENGS